MFAAVRIPASRTSTAYVCYACRSQWRTLSTESRTVSALEALISGVPPPTNPDNTSPSKDPSATVKRNERRRAQRLEAGVSRASRIIATIPNNGGVPKRTRKSKGELTKADAKVLNRAARDMKRVFKERKVPDPSYTTINDDGVVQCWKAQVSFEGQKFEVEALNKKSVKAALDDKVMEYICTTPPPAEVSDAKKTSTEDGEVSGRRLSSRVRVVTSTTPVLSHPTDVGHRMTLKEALTGQRRSRPRERRRSSEDKESGSRRETSELALPTRIRSDFEPTENVTSLHASNLEVVPLHIPQSPVPPLSYGLDRVLFNPGVYRLRDPRSRVYNFDPYLERVVPADEFDFAALKGYKVASTDPTLSNIAAENGLKYFTSTSSLTSVLMTFHFLISQWRPIDISMLSKRFEGPDKTNFTTFTKAPTSIILKPKNGGYAIDKDDDGFGNTVLSLVGRSLEKLLTVPKKEFEKYRRSKVTGKSAIETQDTEEAFHYTGIGNLLVRSQLDGHDPRLPGSGIFDIKTRAVLPVRMDGKGKMDVASSYEIKNDHGQFESFEREYHDMLRAPMLKYSMQARLGRMDGIFVAYHNISRLFGFQYVSLPEIDRAIHGSSDTFRGDQELRASINILQDVLDRASEKFPDQPLRMMFETRPGDVPFMNIFVEPVTPEYLEERAIEKQRQIDEFENAVIFPEGDAKTAGAAADQPWTEINEQVQKEIESDDGIKAESSESLAEHLEAELRKRQEAPAEPKSNVQRLMDMLRGQAQEKASDQDNKAQLAKAQAAAVDIIRETSKFREADIIEPHRPSRKEELTKMIAATKSLDKWIDGLDNDLTPDEERDEQIARLRELTKRTLEEGVHLKSSHYSTATPILALALTVRNKINGQYISGPPEPNREDDWIIEYSIQEMGDNSKAWERYDACKTRRDNASSFGKDDPESDERWYGGRFMSELAEWSRKGGEWRARQDEIDRAVGRVTVFEPIDKSKVVVDGDELGEGVEDYMTWLYEGRGGDGKKEV